MDEGLFAQVNAIYSQAYSEVIPLVIKAVWSGQETEEAVAAILKTSMRSRLIKKPFTDTWIEWRKPA